MANICKNLESQLKAENITLTLYDSKGYNTENESEAVEMLLSNLEDYGALYTYKLPKNKLVDFDWAINKWNKSTSNVFQNFTENFKKILKSKGYFDGIHCYAASYGIGISIIFSYKGSAKKIKDNIDSVLNEYGIEFKNEYSEANWVFRYKISKSADNLKKIESIKY